MGLQLTDIPYVVDQWVWTNFHRQNPSILNETRIGLRIYYMDLTGNINRADIINFKITEIYICGDTNGDSVINSIDLDYLINYFFIGSSEPQLNFYTGDANADGQVDIADSEYHVNYVFVGEYSPETGCR